jgi:hypothetical protein
MKNLMKISNVAEKEYRSFLVMNFIPIEVGYKDFIDNSEKSY